MMIIFMIIFFYVFKYAWIFKNSFFFSRFRREILDSASFWRGNQVDGLPRRHTCRGEDRLCQAIHPAGESDSNLARNLP